MNNLASKTYSSKRGKQDKDIKCNRSNPVILSLTICSYHKNSH